MTLLNFVWVLYVIVFKSGTSHACVATDICHEKLQKGDLLGDDATGEASSTKTEIMSAA
jgi:hypothetical protein